MVTRTSYDYVIVGGGGHGLATAYYLANTFRKAKIAVLEKSWGMPPPTLSVEVTTTSGWTRSGSRTDASASGGGTVNYGQVRGAAEKAVTDAGWQFDFEGGRLP